MICLNIFLSIQTLTFDLVKDYVIVFHLKFTFIIHLYWKDRARNLNERNFLFTCIEKIVLEMNYKSKIILDMKSAGSHQKFSQSKVRILLIDKDTKTRGQKGLFIKLSDEKSRLCQQKTLCDYCLEKHFVSVGVMRTSENILFSYNCSQS